MSKKGVLGNPNTKLLLLVSCKYCTRVYTCYSQLYRMHFKSKISKSISRYKLSRRFYDLVTILLGYKARCCTLWCALNHLSSVMHKSAAAAKRCVDSINISLYACTRWFLTIAPQPRPVPGLQNRTLPNSFPGKLCILYIRRPGKPSETRSKSEKRRIY